MALKKKEETKAAKKEETKAEKRERDKAEYYPVDKILEKAVKINDTITEYNLAWGVYFSLDEEKMRAKISIFEFTFYVRVVEGKNGFFLSFPSHKYKDEWVEDITCYDKDFHAVMKELLAKLAEA